MHDLLTCPFVPIERSDGRDSVSLPQLYAELVADRIEAFPGLGAHQAQAWYQFLAQVGALALLRADWDGAPPGDAETWRTLLAGLTPDCADTAWSLVVADPTRPALLQPPTQVFDRFKPLAETPDGIDLPVTAKNHDRKQAVAIGNAPHHWLYALVTLQTQQGYSGRGGFGVARMNGGLSARVLVDRRQSRRWGPRVGRAIAMLLQRRVEVFERGDYGVFANDNEGLALAWLVPWDAEQPLGTRALDPYFVEICRRIRLTADAEGRIAALGRPSEKARVDAAAFSGNLGDPWVPVEPGNGKALTVSANGFDYRLAHRILLASDFQAPLALKDLPGERDRDSEIHMAVLVRGQGKTEGLHERVIKLPSRIAAALSPEDEDDEDDTDRLTLRQVSKHMVEQAGDARRVLRQAMIVYWQGPEQPDFQSKCADPVTQRLDRHLDERFFDVLFEGNRDGLDARATETAWQRFLVQAALDLAGEVWAGSAAPTVRREKARAASEAVLWGGLRRHLTLAFDDKEDAA
ncbi:MAG: type I-E CRISPR-associated protein Cse1/CasA [Alphaproteobacteria bacterium]|nr:type I-E CRISPR-associated protein Cse1/CasA [Alphaproteobacteria bacterium]